MSSNTVDHSFKRRYSYKLFTNIIGMCAGLLTQAIVPRALGPSAYGSFDFLTSYFSRIIGFLDSGTSSCFYVRLSQKTEKSSLVIFYMYYAGAAAVAVMLFVSFVFLSGKCEWFWPGQLKPFIFLAAGWAFLTWVVNNVLGGMADAYGLTVYSEKARMIQKVFGLALIATLFLFHRLHFFSYFIYHYLMLFFLAGAFLWIFQKRGYSVAQSHKPTRNELKAYSREFYNYAHPFVVVGVVSLLAGIFDRWLLQVYAGSTEQGFYSLSYQIGGICILFTSAMIPLLMREFSIAHGKKDREAMVQLFRRYFPLLYSIAAYFSCFIAVNAGKVVHIFAGEQFGGAVVAATIMAFFPIHQTYGQLSSSIFLATGQTKLYGYISMVFLLASLPLTYFLIAPVGKMGIGAGATGLAIKMVMENVIGVNVQLFYNTKFLKVSFWQCLRHQVLCATSLLFLSACATYGVSYFLKSETHLISGFLVSGILYTLMVIFIGYGFPSLFGVERQDLHSFVRMAVAKVKAR